MSLKMQQLYPNFHSLVSAPSQPLDPRVRRRSLVWTRSSTESTQVMKFSVNPSVPSVTQSTSLNHSRPASTQPIRRRSASQVPTATTQFGQKVIGAHDSFSTSKSISAACASTLPPPPFPFRDDDDDQCAVTNRVNGVLFDDEPSNPDNQSLIEGQNNTVYEPVKTIQKAQVFDTEMRCGNHDMSPHTAPPPPQSLSFVSCQTLIPSLVANSSVQSGVRQRELNFDHSNGGPLQQTATNCPTLILNPLPIQPRSKPVVSTLTACPCNSAISLQRDVDLSTTPVPSRRLTRGPGRLLHSTSLRRQTLVEILPTDWMSKGESHLRSPKFKEENTTGDGARDNTSINEVYVGANCLSSDSGVDVCENDPTVVSAFPYGSLRSAPAEVLRRKPTNSRRNQIVSAFEQNLTTMSQRLQAMTQTTSRKDSELHDLRATIDSLRSQSGLVRQQCDPADSNAALTGEWGTAPNQSATGKQQKPDEGGGKIPNDSTDRTPIGGTRRNSWLRQSIGRAFRKKNPPSSVSKANVIQETKQETDGSHQIIQQSSSHASICDPAANCEPVHNQLHLSEMPQQMACGNFTRPMKCENLSPSTSSIASASSSWSSRSRTSTTSACGLVRPTEYELNEKDRRLVVDRSNTLRQLSDNRQTCGFNETVCPSSSITHQPASLLRPSTPSGYTFMQSELHRLQQLLNERETKLTDVQLEALARAHQVEDLRGQIAQLCSELWSLRSENETLKITLSQRQVQNGVSQNIHLVNGSDKDTGHEAVLTTAVNNHSVCTPLVDLNYDCRVNRVSALIVLASFGTGELPIPEDLLDETPKVAFTSLDDLKTWEELDSRLSLLLTEYTDKLGVRNRLELQELKISTYEIEERESSTWYRRNVEDVPSISHIIDGVDQPSYAELIDILSSLTAVADRPQLVLHLHLADWSEQLSLRCLLNKQWISTTFDFLQTYGCLIFFGSVRNELTRIANAFASHLWRSRKVAQVLHLTVDQAGWTTENLIAQIQHSLNEGSGVQLTEIQPVRVLVLDNLQCIDSQTTFMESIDSVRSNTAPSASPSSEHQSHYILGIWVTSSSDGRPYCFGLPASTTQLTPTMFCSANRCCWAAVDKATEASSADNKQRIHPVHRLHQQLLTKLFHEVTITWSTKYGSFTVWENIKLAEKVATWLSELWSHLETLLTDSESPDSHLEHGLLHRLSPSVLLEWPPSIGQEDLGEAWFLSQWNNHIYPLVRLWIAGTRCETMVNSLAQTISVSNVDDLLSWITSTWPWKQDDSGRQPPIAVNGILHIQEILSRSPNSCTINK